MEAKLGKLKSNGFQQTLDSLKSDWIWNHDSNMEENLFFDTSF
jgi:hypothetical protein